ncbi:DUF2339 domain-containing protein [Verrucomicrobiales bacterium]|nr:DUF2339 domain-containing protein [Verrucomicrobiales bacterium]
MEFILILTGFILAINALVKANQALKENTELRSKLNELLYDKSSQEQKNKELKEQTKSTANKDPDKTVSIPVPPVTSHQPTTSDEKEIDNIDLKIWIDGNTHNTNEPIEIRLFAKDKDGVEAWGKGNLTLLKLSDTTLLPVEVISSWPIELNPLVESNHRLDFNVAEPGHYRLKLTLNDSDLSTIHEFSVTESAVKSAQESAPISSDLKSLKAAAETPKSSPIVHTAKEKVKGPDKRSVESATHSSPAKVEPAKEIISESIEMKLGTYWFVRIGVVLLLTGIATLAWFKKSFFLDLSPSTKVGLFYALSTTMSGLGFWIQKKKEEVKNFGQVLIAGGFAGTYFTTYAAHIFEPVKIIQDPTLALALLFSLGALIVWFAEKLKSETIALFAIGASYYATYVPIIHSGEISPWVILASNLILAIFSVIFMLRNQWFRMPELSMFASYFGFFIWRAMAEDPGLFIVALFACSLWIVYTAAALLSRDNGFKDNERATFITLNNGALFGLMSWDLLKNAESQYWILPLSIGVLLIGCAFFVSKALKEHSLTKNCYLIQGLTLVTLGLMLTKQSESIKGPILAAESVILLFGAIRLKSLIVRYASVAAAAAAVIFGFISIANDSGDSLYSCLSIGGFLLFNAYLTSKKVEQDKGSLLRPIVSYFTVSALAVSITAFLIQADYSLMTGSILIATSVIFCASIYHLRVREFVLLGQIPAIFGALHTFEILSNTEGFGLEPLTLLLLTLGLAHWWRLQKNKFIKESKPNEKQANGISLFYEIIYSSIIISQLLIWLVANHQFSADWLWIGSVAAATITAYSAMTRAKFIGIFSQIFLLIACGIQIGICINGTEAAWSMALIPIGTMLGTNLIIPNIAKRLGSVAESIKRTFDLIQCGYRLAASGLLILWIYRFVPEDIQLWLSVFLSFVCIRASKWRPATEWGWVALAFSLSGIMYIQNVPYEYQVPVSMIIAAAFFFSSRSFSGKESLIASIAYLSVGYIFLAIELMEEKSMLPSMAGVLFLLTVQQITRRTGGKIAIPNEAHVSLIISGAIALFWWSTVKAGEGTEGLRSIIWAGLAVIYFILGLGLKERWYRLMGLGTLGIALLSLVPIILGLRTEMKIASLFVLGAVFVGLGYVYTRYKEKINKLL